MNWLVVIIGIILSIIMVFLSNIILLFSIHPILLILFVILAIIGIISFSKYENAFDFGPMFGIGWAVSFVGIILMEIFGWKELVAPAIIKAVPIYTETISGIVLNTDGRHIIVAILLAIEEPIIIGLLFPLVFEGIHLFFVGIALFIHTIMEKLFKFRYFNICLNFVQNASTPVHEREIMNIIPMGNSKYGIKDDLLKMLREYSCFDSVNNLYWNIDSYKTMKNAIENKLLHTSPRDTEWIMYSVPEYNNNKFFAFKITAINELIKERTFVLETTTGSNFNQRGESKALYRHIRGSKLKSVVIEDDPDFD